MLLRPRVNARGDFAAARVTGAQPVGANLATRRPHLSDHHGVFSSSIS